MLTPKPFTLTSVPSEAFAIDVESRYRLLNTRTVSTANHSTFGGEMRHNKALHPITGSAGAFPQPQ
jgi:hypothetical protein